MQRVLILTVLAFLFFTAMRTDNPRPLAIEVQVAPSAGSQYQLLRRATPFTYTARALVTSPTENAIYGGADVIVAPGERQTVTKKGDGMEVMFTVGVSEKADRASTEVIAKRGDRILLAQKSVVVLRLPGPQFLPR